MSLSSRDAACFQLIPLSPILPVRLSLLCACSLFSLCRLCVQEAMGYKSGSGLGSRSQGMSAPVSDLIEERAGRGGLGFRDAGIERFLSDLPETWDYNADPVRAFFLSSCSLLAASLILRRYDFSCDIRVSVTGLKSVNNL